MQGNEDQMVTIILNEVKWRAAVFIPGNVNAKDWAMCGRLAINLDPKIVVVMFWFRL